MPSVFSHFICSVQVAYLSLEIWLILQSADVYNVFPLPEFCFPFEEALIKEYTSTSPVWIREYKLPPNVRKSIKISVMVLASVKGREFDFYFDDCHFSYVYKREVSSLSLRPSIGAELSTYKRKFSKFQDRHFSFLKDVSPYRGG